VVRKHSGRERLSFLHHAEGGAVTVGPAITLTIRTKEIALIRLPSPDRLWWARLDSNQEPTDYESAALTVELRALAPISYTFRQRCRPVTVHRETCGRGQGRVTMVTLTHDGVKV
jgi:hypothetical protein